MDGIPLTEHKAGLGKQTLGALLQTLMTNTRTRVKGGEFESERISGKKRDIYV